MRSFSPARILLCAGSLGLLIPGTGAQTPGEHDTGVVQMAVYDDGTLGRDGTFAGTGFVYRGDQNLFYSTLVVATSFTQTSGTLYSHPSDFVVADPIQSIPPPSALFDQAFEATFEDSNARVPIGVRVTQRTYSSTEPGYTDFIGLDYTIENVSGGVIENMYVGNFADWDIGPGVDNRGCFDDETQTVYMWSDTPGTYYQGVSVVGATASGWDVVLDDGSPTKPCVYCLLSQGGRECPNGVGDRRSTIGQGPFDIANGESLQLLFCMIGGDDLDALIANANACHQAILPIKPATEPVPDGSLNTHRLSPLVPNPVTTRGQFSLEVAEAQPVHIGVYDALGREVAVLHQGALIAGQAHRFTFDSAGLPAGMYVLRVVGARFTASQTVSMIQ